MIREAVLRHEANRRNAWEASSRESREMYEGAAEALRKHERDRRNAEKASSKRSRGMYEETAEAQMPRSFRPPVNTSANCAAVQDCLLRLDTRRRREKADRARTNKVV